MRPNIICASYAASSIHSNNSCPQSRIAFRCYEFPIACLVRRPVGGKARWKAAKLGERLGHWSSRWPASEYEQNAPLLLRGEIRCLHLSIMHLHVSPMEEHLGHCIGRKRPWPYGLGSYALLPRVPCMPNQFASWYGPLLLFPGKERMKAPYTLISGLLGGRMAECGSTFSKMLRSGGAFSHRIASILRKIELHLHLDGSISPGFIRGAIESERMDRKQPPGFSGNIQLEEAARHTDAADLLNLIRGRDRSSMGNSLGVFDWLCSFMQTADQLESAATDVCNQLASEGVIHAEIRFCPALHTLGTHSNPSAGKLTCNEVLEAV